MDVIHDARDNSIKSILREPELFVEFLKDYVQIDLFALLLKKINVPDDEITVVTEQLYERRLPKMFAGIQNYDVQATRQESEAKLSKQIFEAIKRLKQGADVATVAKETGLSLDMANELADLQKA